MVNFHEDKTKNTSSRRSGSSRASTRKSHRSTSSRKSGSSKQGSRSPNRSEPRRSKRSKDDLEAKEKARAERGNTAAELGAVDHTGAVIEPVVEEEGQSSSRNKPRKNNRRSQQDKGVAKDATAKVKYLLDRSNEANAGPAPGAHANSRGDEVAKDQKSGKGRFSRPLGTQSVFTMEERVRMEAEKGQDQDGLVMASAIDDSQDEGLARALLNSMLDQQMEESDKKQSTKKSDKTSVKKKKSGDSNQESKEEENQESSDGTDWERSKLKKGVQFFRLLCCIIVLGAAGIGTWIALRDNNNAISDTKESSSSGGDPNATTDTDTVPSNSTDDPFSTVNPSSPNATSGAPSGPPKSNTGADITFDPPSEEDCAAISNGGTIQGQDSMSIQSYLLDLDATPFLPMDLGISAGMIEEKLIELLTPALTGCDRDIRKLQHRHRHLVDGFSYAIGNVIVAAFGVEGVSCLDASNPQCRRVSVTLGIVVKDESVKVTAVITELSLFLGAGVLASNLELAELFESIKVVNLGSTDQTKSPSTPDNSPSMEPSKIPSVVSSPTLLEIPMVSASPTRSPTAVSTPVPTSAPAFQETTLSPTSTSLPPTPGPTPPPTPQPDPQGTPPTSFPPTIRPTPFPTLPPTPFPTARPVAQPTFTPTAADPTPPPSTTPTELPSTSPTNAPVVESPFPSETPSAAPSASPSKTPSSSPTSGPSRTPSSQPSPNPTSGPTNRPSTYPSYQPSTAPSPAPVPISLSTNRCAYLESVLGNRASLHQLAFDWMCNVDTWEPSEDESYPEQWHDRYAVVAYVYASNDDDPDTFNSSQLSGASTQSTCSWLTDVQGNRTCLQTALGSKVVYLAYRVRVYTVWGTRKACGYVPSAIGLLTNLDTLDNVKIADGPLPSEIGLLTALQGFGFDWNRPGYSELGTIPTEIGLLTKLDLLTGHDAGLKGTIPSELMNLTALTYLDISNNQLSGTIPPSIIELRAMWVVVFSSNKLTGTIPPLRPQYHTYQTGHCLLQNNLFDDVTNGVSANCNT